MTKGTILALAAVSGAALLAPTASAQTTVNNGDLLMSMRAASGTGASINYELDLGSASLYYGSTPGTSFTVSGFVAGDVSTTYGSGWLGRSDLYWNIVGSTGPSSVGSRPAYTLWASAADPSTAWTRGSVNGQAATDANIESLYSGFAGSLFAGSHFSTLKSTTSPNSYNLASDDGSGNLGTFGAFYPSTEGTAGQVLDLYEMQTTSGRGHVNIDPGSLVGYFYFDPNNAGALTFSVSPVPEPGTATLLGLGAFLFCSHRRLLRSRQA